MSATPEGLRVSTGLRLSTQSSFWVITALLLALFSSAGAPAPLYQAPIANQTDDLIAAIGEPASESDPDLPVTSQSRLASAHSDGAELWRDGVAHAGNLCPPPGAPHHTNAPSRNPPIM